LLLSVEVRRLTASVLLVRGLGGGWTVGDLPGASEASSLRGRDSR
jgi:hypothetical protein